MNVVENVEEDTMVEADKAVLNIASEDAVVCEEELEIAVLPPIDMVKWIQLRRNLLYIPHLKILCTAGSLMTGALVTVTVGLKTPLLDILMQMPEVERVELGVSQKVSDRDYSWDLSFKLKPSSCQRTRLYLTLKRYDKTTIV